MMVRIEFSKLTPFLLEIIALVSQGPSRIPNRAHAVEADGGVDSGGRFVEAIRKKLAYGGLFFTAKLAVNEAQIVYQKRAMSVVARANGVSVRRALSLIILHRPKEHLVGKLLWFQRRPVVH